MLEKNSHPKFLTIATVETIREVARNISRFVFRNTARIFSRFSQHEPTVETLLGFSLELSFSPSSGDTILACILDGSVDRV